jgi:sugar phosphate permease
VGESAAFPGGSRALLKWLPVRQRAIGQGIQHAGSRFGAAITPPIVVYLMTRMHWPLVFDLFGCAGIIMAAAWYLYYRDSPAAHPGVNSQELEMIGSGIARPAAAAKRSVPWRKILRSRDLRYLSAAYFCYAWVLYVYLQWVPTYLMEARGYSQLKMGMAASFPLLAATAANVLGGWISDRVASRTGNLRHARVVVAVAGFSLAGVCLIAGVLAPGAAAAWDG